MSTKYTPDHEWVEVHGDGTATVRRQSTYYQAAALNRRDNWLESPPGKRLAILTNGSRVEPKVDRGSTLHGSVVFSRRNDALCHKKVAFFRY